MQFALQADANGKYRNLGDAVKDAKNYTYQTSGDVTNNRKFTLLGDPAMTIAYPTLKVRITKVNGLASSQADTLSAKEKINIEDKRINLFTTKDAIDNLICLNFPKNNYQVPLDFQKKLIDN